MANPLHFVRATITGDRQYRQDDEKRWPTGPTTRPRTAAADAAAHLADAGHLEVWEAARREIGAR
ncbi:hypothetical protein [Streptomyces sp. NBC_01296]|uniref:hypothetical protein n=1 Tax=Streptomyces sp. NBC_01296 TaxID=2903816 RepID=UPI002E14F595|nr:hypothetical protein OG299_04860 [Streptomyces sp. NBC_01296]WSW63674.1 hypothetical protein OG513_36755 [Streptomyces sp. NBC_00998]